jgi:hypothetical protein
MSLKLRKKVKFASVLLASALAVACGDSTTSDNATNANTGSSNSGNEASASAEGTVSILITDNLTDQYTKVWVRVLSVSLLAADGTEVSVFDSAEGQLYNLRELASVAELLTSADVPVGAYRGVSITVANDAQLVDTSDQTIDAKFSLDATSKTFRIPAKLDVKADDASALAIDFDLAKFTFDPATGLLRAKIVVKHEHEMGDLEHVGARLVGTVSKVEDGDTFVLVTRQRKGQRALTVNLSANAVVGDPATGGSAADTSLLEVNDHVAVQGSFDPATLSVEAESVLIHEAPVGGGRPHGSGDDPAMPGRAHVVGVVKSFDGQTLVLDVKGANFMPAGSELAISNVANAFFAHGSLESLAAEQHVEIKGSWDGTTFTAKAINIQGAEGDGQNYAQLKAKVVSVAETSITVAVVELKGSDATLEPGSELTLAIEDSFFHRGSKQCLAVDAEVMVRGAYDGTTFTANGIHVLGDCNQPGDMGKPGWQGGTPRGGKKGGKPHCETPVEGEQPPVSTMPIMAAEDGATTTPPSCQPPQQGGRPQKPGEGRGGKPGANQGGGTQQPGGNAGGETSGTAYTRVAGVVQSVNGKQAVLATVGADGMADGKTITIDLTNAKAKGTATVDVGVTVQAVGKLEDEILMVSAYRVEAAS